MKVGIFLPNWIGDVVMATPTLRALRDFWGPSANLLGIHRPYLRDVLAGTTWLDDYLPYHPKSRDPALQVSGVLANLRQRQLDGVVLLTNSLRSGWLAWRSGAKQRVGYVRYGRGALLTHKLYSPRRGWSYLPTPAVDSYLQLAYAIGCPPASRELELATTPEEEQLADAVWKKFQLPAGERVVVLNSGGAYGAAKHWPTAKFAQLAKRIAQEFNFHVLVNCGPAERELARAIVAGAQDARVVSLADEEVPIGLSKAAIKRSRLLVSTDSGPRFFATAFGVPVVALFGPTDLRWSQTHAVGEMCLAEKVPCGPCMERTCPLKHHRCMEELSVERVFAAVQQQLNRRTLVAA